MKFIALIISFSFFISIAASPNTNVSETCGATIPRHWFGPSCKYRCQCEFYDQCDVTSGTCGNGGCKPGYTGTACQYVNAAFNGTIKANNFTAYANEAGLRTLVDGKPELCLLEDGTSNKPLSVQPNVVSWVDVITLLLSTETRNNNKLAAADDLQLTYYDVNNRSIRLDSPEIDLTGVLLTHRLSTPALVSRVQVQANKTLSICEITLRTGRNMAAKKASGPGPMAELAVDGSLATCYNITQDSASWTVALGMEVFVWRLRITTSKEVKVTSNVRINVTLHDGTMKEVRTTPVDGQFLQLVTPEAADNLTIWNTDSLVSLCEVEVFGDCQDGKYGWECQENCTCVGSCDTVLGACFTAGCKPGFMGNNCKTKCPEGFYGDQCKTPCSKTCRNSSCNHVTGVCLNGCAENWTGSYCTECSEGFYGDQCKTPCSKNCRNSSCNHVTGVCLNGCTENWTGSYCTDCVKGRYGVDCSQTCSSSCKDSDCHGEAHQCRTDCGPGSQCAVKAGSVILRAASVYLLMALIVALCL